MNKLGLAPLVIAAAMLAGCSGSSTTSSGPASPSVGAGSASSASSAVTPSAGAPSSASSSASSPSATSSPTETTSSTGAPSSTSTPAAAGDQCAKLSGAEVNRLAGTSYTAQSKSTSRCTYGSKDGKPSGQDVGLLTGLKATTASLASLVASEKRSLNSSSSKTVDIDGADDAAVVYASDQGKHVVSVLAKRQGVVYIVITEGGNSSANYTTAATKVMAALIAD